MFLHVLTWEKLLQMTHAICLAAWLLSLSYHFGASQEWYSCSAYCRVWSCLFCAYHFGYQSVSFVYQYIIQFSHKVEFKVSSLLDKLTSFSHELYIGHCNCVVKLTSFHINYILDIVIMWSGTCVGTKLKNGKSYQPFRVFHLFFDIIFFADSYHPSSNHNHKKNFPGASVVKR